jgi:hypothetical protein
MISGAAVRQNACKWALVLAVLTGCDRKPESPRAHWIPLAQLQATYGRLITVGNHPTPDQHGTGERLGLFRDDRGRIYGLPLTIESDGGIRGCAPPGLRSAAVTDTIPAASTLVGSMNEPTGWRAGTGKLELLLRNGDGSIYVQPVTGGEIAGGPVCWAPDSPGPPQKLQYYLIVPNEAK